jgi:phosphoglycolate phosphatase-like HAD superfamily hydrolase
MIETKNVIFDFDGTLVDTSSLFHYTSLLKEYPINSKEHREKKKEYLSHLDECNVYNGIIDVLEYLTSKGYNLYIVSGNTKGTITAALKYFKMDKYFDFDKIVSGFSPYRRFRISKRNGNPTLFKYLLTEHNLDPDTCIAFGNETYDRIAANNANIEAYDCLWGATDESKEQMNQHFFVLDTPMQITELLN